MKRSRKPHDHGNAERWLLTYADLITLLLGLFVILYAISKVDAGKYAEIVSALSGVFGSPRGMLTGNPALMQQPSTVLQTERQRIVADVRAALDLESGSLPITITENERGVTVHIMEELLFASGSADIKLASLPALDTLSGVLRRLPNDLRVEGHTDNVPINTSAFPSNWHLSVARALNVAYYLIQRHRLTQERVSVVGYSEFRPLVANATPEQRSQNRRVDIVILATGSPREESTSYSAKGTAAAPPGEVRL